MNNGHFGIGLFDINNGNFDNDSNKRVPDEDSYWKFLKTSLRFCAVSLTISRPSLHCSTKHGSTSTDSLSPFYLKFNLHNLWQVLAGCPALIKTFLRVPITHCEILETIFFNLWCAQSHSWYLTSTTSSWTLTPSSKISPAWIWWCFW